MKADKYEIKLVREESETERIEAYNKIFGWLLKRYYEGCEGFGCAGVFESIDGGTGRERVFDTGPEG
ncbi:MAG TPA: hypothetical protein PLS45_09750 [Bacillota bacterium]|nr:hypothetical protein [Bacillota bacterium]HPW41526.1 hypothetical protein [Bacillota bacterium]